jgi:hypothetical protein
MILMSFALTWFSGLIAGFGLGWFIAMWDQRGKE